MMVLGADMHKRSHTVAAVSAATGALQDEKTVQVSARGFESLLDWGRALEGERVWALEDCRHVSGALERFLIARGERVIRVPTNLMAGERRGGRQRGKSDSIDAVAVARAALREGLDSLPIAQLAGPELDIRLLARPSRAARPPALAAQQRSALAPARPLAGARAARQRAAVGEVERADEPAPGARRADRSRPDRSR